MFSHYNLKFLVCPLPMRLTTNSRLISTFTWSVAAIWTLVLGGSLVWNLRNAEQQSMDMAYAEARANVNKDVTIRRWVTEHGGVYVPITDKQQPVPFSSHVPGRDVTTTDGRQLTLLNPSSVIRQIMDHYARDYGVQGRITGLKYLNPGNAPDAWEKGQLEAFTHGDRKEAWAIADINGQPYLRYLRAMFMEPGCEKCHAGYKRGDIGGATGLNLPLAPYFQEIKVARGNLGLTHAIVWLLGLAGIGLSSGMVRRREHTLRQFKAIIDSTDEAIISKTLDGVITSWNPGAERIFGYTAAEAIGQPMQILIPPDRLGEDSTILARVLRGEGIDNLETVRRCKDGRLIDISATISAILDEDNTIIGASQIARDITERRVAADKIEHLAFYDSLTDLPNRRLLLDRLQQALTSSTRHHRYGALMLLDMDDFKTLNDTLGHDVGDRFLVEVANRLQGCVREGDTVARQGGDEFVVILEDLNEDALAAMQAESVAVKIQRAINRPFLLDLTRHGGMLQTSRYHCTSSIGITLFRGSAISVEELMKRADTAMYQAKAAGRDTLRFFDPEMQAAVAARAMLDNDLRKAVQEKQFLLYYQPQVDGAGRITGAEALLRWRHPQRGTVSPAEFIPQAEATGLILPIGHWVLETACAQLVAWASQPDMSHLTVAVNVSARQFRHRDFVDQVLAVLDSRGAPPQKLKLELTESLLVDDVEDIIAKMTALKIKGVGFSLDDFGTGYSSLAYLKRLPLDQLKIDQSFVRNVLTDSNEATIARTIVALAQSMGLAVIAEGVETGAQREFLAANGCHAYQGYLFSRPLPLDDFEAFVKRI